MTDKEKIREEVERLFKENRERSSIEGYAVVEQLRKILAFIDSLEVKEVDLEKHLKEDIEDIFFDIDGVAVKGATSYLTVEDIKDVAKHFFELGLKTQRGE